MFIEEGLFISTGLEQIESGRNPMPLIVGESILSLDELKKNPKAPFRGSPILLQVEK